MIKTKKDNLNDKRRKLMVKNKDLKYKESQSLGQDKPYYKA